MENQIRIIVPITPCPRTGLARVARYVNHTVHANKSVSVSYKIDTLDLNGEVYQSDYDDGAITYHSRPVSRGDQTIVDVMIPEIEALLDAEMPLLTDIMNTLNEENGEEE